MPHPNPTERAILDRAIDMLAQKTGLRLRAVNRKVTQGEPQVDAWVQLGRDGAPLAAEIKRWAQHGNLGALVHQLRQMPADGLLVADYVNPAMADKLREQGIQFIDEAGNAYINQPPVYVLIKGERHREHFKPGVKTTNRAFEPTGLIVTYAFLIQRELVNATYRAIAHRTGAALGTIGWVINGLKEAGFILDKGKKQGRHLVNVKPLLDRWVELWPEKLKPKYYIGTFTTGEPNWWKHFDIEPLGGYWGGEIAAAHYTSHLKPTVATVYVPEVERLQLMKQARLRVTDELRAGPQVELYRPFWPQALDEFEHKRANGYVHPILAYAELVATADPRNLEVAKGLYDDYIARLVGED